MKNMRRNKVNSKIKDRNILQNDEPLMALLSFDALSSSSKSFILSQRKKYITEGPSRNDS